MTSRGADGLLRCKRTFQRNHFGVRLEGCAERSGVHDRHQAAGHTAQQRQGDQQANQHGVTAEATMSVRSDARSRRQSGDGTCCTLLREGSSLRYLKVAGFRGGFPRVMTFGDFPCSIYRRSALMCFWLEEATLLTPG